MASSRAVFSSKWIRGLVVGASSAVIGIALLLTGALQGPEQTTWDIRVRQFAGPSPASGDVVVIHVDQSDLDTLLSQFGVGWPWPRSIYSYMVDFAHAGGAESITFDIILEDEGSGGFMDDQIFRDSAGAFGGAVFGAQMLGSAEENQALPEDQRDTPEPWPAYISPPDFSVDISDAERSRISRTFLGASFPYEYVIPSNAVLAFVNQVNDDDGVFRRYRLLNYHLEQPIPALAVGPLVASRQEALTFTASPGGVTVGDVSVPLDADGKVLLKYTISWDPPTRAVLDSDPYQRNSFFAREMILSATGNGSLLTREIPADVLQGKHIFVGLSASGLLDLRPTPLNPRAPGVIVHATMLDNLLSGNFMRDFPMWTSILLIVILSIAAALLASLVEKVYLETPVILVFLAIPFGLAFGGYALGLWVPLVVPLVAVVVALAGANVANFATEGAQRRFIRGAFSQYLSPAVISQLEQDPEKLKLGGERRELTMYFSDVEGFTSISERLDPEQLTGLINDYLSPMTDIIIEGEEGTIDKYEGDAIIAFWNAPTDQPDHAVRGVRAALRCQQRLRELNPVFSQIAGTEMKMRIGLNTGPAVVGNMGSNVRFDYTMLGDSVNLAARLESANKQFGTYTMISKNTLDRLDESKESRPLGFVGLVGEVAVRELGRLQVKGKLEPVTVFEAMTEEELNRRMAMLTTFREGLNLYYNARFQEARDAFASIRDDDPAAAKYVQACEPLVANPPKAWDGRMTLEAK